MCVHLALDRPQVGVPDGDKHTLNHCNILSDVWKLIGGSVFTYLTPGRSCCWVMSSESSSDPPE